MNESKIPVRYAKALFLAAHDSEQMEVVALDMRSILQLCKSSDDFEVFLQSRVIKRSEKRSALMAIFENKIADLSLRFLLMLAENRRESFMARICVNFLDLSREHEGIRSVTITTANELPKGIYENIKQFLEAKTGDRVELATKVKPEIVGGLILRMGDLQFDGSISSHLSKIKESLLQQNSFLNK